tara:strand:+ start:399 stop:587 length:189 start_codon:yes stop_codon:yes gene_type:complete
VQWALKGELRWPRQWVHWGRNVGSGVGGGSSAMCKMPIKKIKIADRSFEMKKDRKKTFILVS